MKCHCGESLKHPDEFFRGNCDPCEMKRMLPASRRLADVRQLRQAVQTDSRSAIGSYGVSYTGLARERADRVAAQSEATWMG